MGESILIYDSNASDIARLSKMRAVEIGARMIGVASIPDLKAQLTLLKSSGAKIDLMLFYTHGEAGTIFFGESTAYGMSIFTTHINRRSRERDRRSGVQKHLGVHVDESDTDQDAQNPNSTRLRPTRLTGKRR